MGWLKKKVLLHWQMVGRKTAVTIVRDYKRNRVVIYIKNGRCMIYTYNGEWISG
jgi:hypothetical protein